MRKSLLWITTMLLAALLLAPGAWAQTLSPEEVVQAYYVALEEAAASGDFSALLDLFVDDATVMAPLSPVPVTGKTAMQAMFAGMSAMMKGMSITVGDISVEGDQVTVSYTMAVEGMAGEIPATDTFVVQESKIQSLTIEIAPQALAGITQPSALPTTGGAGVNLLPGLLVLGGAALVALSWRLKH